MKWRPHGFLQDEVTLTWRDLLLLILGIELTDSGCKVRRA